METTVTVFRETTDDVNFRNFHFIIDGDDGDTLTFLEEGIAIAEVNYPRWESEELARGITDTGNRLIDELMPTTPTPTSWSDALKARTTDEIGIITKIVLRPVLSVGLLVGTTADWLEAETKIFATIEALTGYTVRLGAETPARAYA